MGFRAFSWLPENLVQLPEMPGATRTGPAGGTGRIPAGGLERAGICSQRGLSPCYENGNPLKLHGYHWLTDQDLYDIELQLQCSSNNVTFFESNDPNLRNTIYDLDIIINIESKLDENYKTTYETSNRIFAINQYSQI